MIFPEGRASGPARSSARSAASAGWRSRAASRRCRLPSPAPSVPATAGSSSRCGCTCASGPCRLPARATRRRSSRAGDGVELQWSGSADCRPGPRPSSVAARWGRPPLSCWRTPASRFSSAAAPPRRQGAWAPSARTRRPAGRRARARHRGQDRPELDLVGWTSSSWRFPARASPQCSPRWGRGCTIARRCSSPRRGSCLRSARRGGVRLRARACPRCRRSRAGARRDRAGASALVATRDPDLRRQLRDVLAADGAEHRRD